MRNTIPLPRTKLDIKRAKAITELGYPAVQPVLSDLFRWLQDMNWPVAHVLAPFLVTIGAPLLPEIQRVLATTDAIWKYWVLRCIVQELPIPVVIQLERELQHLVTHPTSDEIAEGVPVVAQEIIDSITK